MPAAQVDIDAAKAALSSVIALKARMKKPAAAETVTREDLVTTRPKPEKRKNAKERAQARADKKRGHTETVEETVAVAEAANAAALNAEATSAEAQGLSTAHPKPEKRLNAKQRAQAKFKNKAAEDGTTPMTATAKSKAAPKADKAKAKSATKKAARNAAA